MRVKKRVTLAAAATVAVSAIAAAGVVASPLAEAQPGAGFLGGFSTVTTVGSTVPANGDVNPYGVAVVPHTQGKLVKGEVLVSNFNNSANTQGTGTTIVSVSPAGNLSVFAQINASHLPGACPGGVGLTTALAILNGGWVVVGSLPTNAGNPATSKAGCLIVLNSNGRVVETFAGHGLNGPWDMTAVNTESPGGTTLGQEALAALPQAALAPTWSEGAGRPFLTRDTPLAFSTSIYGSG